MCFSPEASFASGVVLFPAGLYCLTTASRKAPTFRALAALPLLFGLQQVCEGFVWVGLQSDNLPLVRGAGLLFLFFALFFWPFWVPFSVSFIEPRERVRGLLSVVALLALGAGWALYAPIVLDPQRLSIAVVNHSIRYHFIPVPAFERVPGEFWRLLYLATICCPLLVCFNRHFRAFAWTLAISGVVSHLVFWYAFESVWCFFAAVLSVQLCYAFGALPAQEREEGGNRVAPSR
jgi:hypothetical protein